MTRRAVLAVLGGLLVLAALAALNFPLYDHVREQRVLEQTGVTESVGVTSTDSEGQGDDQTYVVAWEFLDSDVSGRTEVDEQTFREAEDQRTIDVIYPAGREQAAYPVGRTFDPAFPTWVLWADVAVLALLILLGATVGRSRVRGAADRFLSGDSESSGSGAPDGPAGSADASEDERHVTA